MVAVSLKKKKKKKRGGGGRKEDKKTKEKQNKKHDIDPLSNHESAANKNKNQKANDM